MFALSLKQTRTRFSGMIWQRRNVKRQKKEARVSLFFFQSRASWCMLHCLHAPFIHQEGLYRAHLAFLRTSSNSGAEGDSYGFRKSVQGCLAVHVIWNYTDPWGAKSIDSSASPLVIFVPFDPHGWWANKSSALKWFYGFALWKRQI